MKEIRLGPLAVQLAGGEDREGGGNGPVVILMHGFGAPAGDLVPLWRTLPVPREVRFVFPAAPLELEPGAPAAFAPRAWWMIDVARFQARAMSGDLEPLFDEVPYGLDAARAAVTGMLDDLEGKLGVTSDRVILGGFSQGAMLATDVVLRDKRAFAGLVILSGTLIARREWSELMPARRGLQVLQSHGRADPILPFAAAERLHATLSEAGLGTEFVRFNGGHAIPDQALDRLSAFISKVFDEKP
ncbi:MAG TPA: hypothetical protein VGI10_10495 [Polyangiaceae bacterium]|jgi:phospholipase/carboxylesterase